MSGEVLHAAGQLRISSVNVDLCTPFCEVPTQMHHMNRACVLIG